MLAAIGRWKLSLVTPSNTSSTIPPANDDGTYDFEVVATSSVGQEDRNCQSEAFMIVDLDDSIQPALYLPVVFRAQQ